MYIDEYMWPKSKTSSMKNQRWQINHIITIKENPNNSVFNASYVIIHINAKLNSKRLCDIVGLNNVKAY